MGKLYCIPRLQDIKKYLEFAEKYNACFEYNDFFIPKILDDSFAIDKVVKQYMEVRHVYRTQSMEHFLISVSTVKTQKYLQLVITGCTNVWILQSA